MNYPIAEVFDSVQGEGQWTGTRMTFVRFAGCNVGRGRRTHESEIPWIADCTDWQGNSFMCDTDYRKKKTWNEQQIVDAAKSTLRACLTGGEPLMYDILPLLRSFFAARVAVHIETSGTHSLLELRNLALAELVGPIRYGGNLWITVSPKLGCLQSSWHLADEIKILVGEQFDEDRLCEMFQVVSPTKMWLQPVNLYDSIDEGNLKKCLEIQQRHLELRISTQMQKVWQIK